MKKYTQGPWKIGGYNSDSDGSVISSTTFPRRDIAYMQGGNINHVENAHLISAAPDLLEALESAQAILNPLSNIVKTRYAKHAESVRDKIREAIAKARGDKL